MLISGFYKNCGDGAVVTRFLNNYGSCLFSEKLIPLMMSFGLEEK